MPLRNNSLNQAPPSNFVGSELYSASELPSLSHFISSSASRLLNTRARPDFSTYPETIRSSALPSPKLLSRSTTVEPSPVDDSIRSSSVRNSSSQRSSLGSKDGLPNSELRNSSHQLSINLHEKYPRPACISTSAASSESVPVQLSPFSSHLRRSTGSESRSSIALADRGISLTSLASRNSLKRGKESQTTSNSEIIFPAEFPSNKNSSGDVRMDLDELIPIPSIEKAETKKIDLNAFLSRNRLELQSPKRFNQLDLGTSHLNLLTSADIFHDDKFGVFLASKSNPITPLYCDKENESEVLPTPQPKFENPVLNNEPSGILMTPGSPISFSWSGIEGDWPLGNAEENSEAKDYDERTQSHELSRRMAEDSKPNANAATLSFFQSMGHLAGNPTSSMIRPRLRSSLELVLRHLVFSRKETSSILSVTSQDGINYYELYGNGLVYGSSHNLATFPVAGEASDRGAIRHTYMEDEPPVNEALHSLLKDVFYLDMSLMVDLCGPMMMGKSASRCLSSDSNREDCLHNWLSGLTEVHRHLLPASRALWQMEVQMSSQLTLAQGMVVVKDQIELSRMTGGNVGLSVVEGLNFRNTSAISTILFITPNCDTS
ncbi:hypothetical protein BC830DRAFT_424787 [Chytriomyces sp. MP71]|nr:hypothetical protein BC830DRAFT_424787 [Chytriomyces sp. MP71]